MAHRLEGGTDRSVRAEHDNSPGRHDGDGSGPLSFMVWEPAGVGELVWASWCGLVSRWSRASPLRRRFLRSLGVVRTAC